MKNRSLNTKIRNIIASMALISFVACNNEESANNSTITDSTETMAASPDSTATASVPVKRRGKASVSIKEDDATVKMEKDNQGYYNRTDMAPAYPGGQNSLENYITSNIEYPQDAIDNTVEGTVYVRFGVDEKGKISNVSTVGSKLGHGLDEEAIRVVSKMPDWTPGQVKGKNVKTWRTLPISYKLDS